MPITIQRIGWEDEPSEATPIDSGNLKAMENNAENAINELEKEMTKSAILVYNNATQNLNVGSEVTVNLNSFDAEDRKGTDLQLSSNKITFKKAGFVVVSYKIYLNSGFGVGNNIICKLYKNSKEVSRFQYRPGVNAGHSFCSEARIIQVEENDAIELHFINYSSNCTIGNSAKSLANSINIFYI